MNIGETIRHLRRERDITQEVLAEYLGVSSKAVSQWECSRTMPDIAQLPVLANVFEVTIDELLGVDVSAKKNKIAEYCLRGEEALANGDGESAVAIMREGLLQYPDSHKLMVKLVSHLYSNFPNDEIKAEASALLDKVLSECTDTVVRNEAIELACRFYPKIGRVEDAICLAESMKSAINKLDLLPDILQGHEQFEAYRDMVFAHVNAALSGMLFYAGFRENNENYFFDDKERLAIYKKILAGCDLFFENGDYMYEAQIVEMAAKHAARICACRGDIDEAIRYASKCADGSIQFDTYDWDAPHTSLLWRGFVFGGYCVSEHNRSYYILECFSTDDDFAVLRENVEFNKILERLRVVAR